MLPYRGGIPSGLSIPIVHPKAQDPRHRGPLAIPSGPSAVSCSCTSEGRDSDECVHGAMTSVQLVASTIGLIGDRPAPEGTPLPQMSTFSPTASASASATHGGMCETRRAVGRPLLLMNGRVLFQTTSCSGAAFLNSRRTSVGRERMPLAGAWARPVNKPGERLPDNFSQRAAGTACTTRLEQQRFARAGAAGEEAPIGPRNVPS